MLYFRKKSSRKSQKQKTLPFLLFWKMKNKNRKTGITKFDCKKMSFINDNH